MNLTSIVRAATAAAIVATPVVAIAEALAQEPTTTQSGPVQAVAGSAQRITMTMGKGQVFQTPVPYTKISVSDEKIVNVTPQSNREFVFTPKAIGSTNVLVFDEKNALIATLDINVVSQTPQGARAETYDEIPGSVRVYNAPWRGPNGAVAPTRSLANPSFYHCNLRNCQLALTPNARAGTAREAPYAGAGRAGEALYGGPGPSGEAPNAGPGPSGEAPNGGPGPSGTPAASPQAGPPTGNENPQ